MNSGDHRSMRSCCTGFSVLLQNAGQKGLALVPKHEDDRREVLLQFRVCDRDKLPWLRAEIRKDGELLGGVAIAGNFPVQCCPACGTRVRQLIEADVPAFDAHALRSSDLW